MVRTYFRGRCFTGCIRSGTDPTSKLLQPDLETACTSTTWAFERMSVGFIRFVFHPRLIDNPVHFPSLASIIRKGLFKMGRIRGGVGPNKPNQDAFSIQHVLGVELTPSILKLADLGRE